MKNILSALILCLSLTTAHAVDFPANFNFDGILLDGSSNPITTSVSIKFQIYNPGGNCLLFEETHASVTPETDGSFSLKVGAGSRASVGVDGGLAWKTIFHNDSQLRATSSTNCTAGYTPAANEGRKLKVTVDGTPLSPDYNLSPVPMASVAQTLQGKSATDFMPSAPYTLPATDGTSNQVLQTNGAGAVSWATVSGGSGITSLNGLTNATQTLTMGTAGSTPAWSSTSAIHTLNIPMASASGVTAGLISKTDYDNFTAKMSTPSGSVDATLRWDGTNWVATTGLQISGSGYVTLMNNPSSGTHAATKDYVDTAVSSISSSYVPAVGGTYTGSVGFPAGAAFAPTAWFGTSDTGFFSPNTGELAVTNSGVETVRINNAGYVGIGTSGPTANLDVNGTTKLGNAGSLITAVKNFSNVTCALSPVAASDTGYCTATVSGVTTSDNLAVNCQPTSTPAAQMIHSCYVSGTNTVTITVQNIGVGPSISTSNWNITVTKF